ncbi:MAG: hypothetical protein OHK0039_30920 [Bacteroidia bacterium]
MYLSSCLSCSRCRTVIAGLVLGLCLLSACRSPDALPRSLQGTVLGRAAAMRDAILLTAGVPRNYRLHEGTAIREAETQWQRIYATAEAGYRSLEVYNVFVHEDGRREYYVLEFAFDHLDSLRRFDVADYRFVATADTAYLTDADRMEARLRARLVYDTLAVYELWGYAHPGDSLYSQVKYWSPQVGTVMIWFGGEETLEWDAPGDTTLAQLKAWLRGRIDDLYRGQEP